MVLKNLMEETWLAPVLEPVGKGTGGKQLIRTQREKKIMLSIQPQSIQPQRKTRAFILILLASAMIGLLPSVGSAKSIKPRMPVHPLDTLLQADSWDQRTSSSTKSVVLQQAASGGTDAGAIFKIRIAYFTSADCTGTMAGPGLVAYNTPNGGSYTLPTMGTSFGLVASSVWYVGSTVLGINDMTTIQSIAVTLKSTTENTPQSNFSGHSFTCAPVTCSAGPSGSCPSANNGAIQTFTLKTTAAVGDPVDGGVIGCQDPGDVPEFNIVVATSDQSAGQEWGSTVISTNATSPYDGATNTTAIVDALDANGGVPYAAQTCNQLSVSGGFTSGWFLPSGSTIVNGNPTTDSQLNCLYTNREAIANGSLDAGGAGFEAADGVYYWSSTEATAFTASNQTFVNEGQRSNAPKLLFLNRRVRCVQAF